MIVELKKQKLISELEKADYLLADIVRNKGKPSVDNPLPFEDALSTLWTEDFNKTFLAHLKNLEDTGELDILLSIMYNPELPPELVEAQFEGLVSRLSQPFGVEWAENNKEKVHEIIAGMYGAGIIMAQQIAHLTDPSNFQFSLIDTRAINQLDNIGLIWSSVGAKKEIITPIVSRLAKQALTQGLGTVQTGELFKEGLRNIIPLRSDIYYTRLASVVIGRARSFSRILAFNRLGFTYLEHVAIGDERMCPTCGLLNGTVIRVSDAVNQVNRTINASSPEELIEVAPFVNGIDLETDEFVLSNGIRISTSASSAELSKAGLSIPVHPECRCSYLAYTM